MFMADMEIYEGKDLMDEIVGEDGEWFLGG